MKRLVTGIPGLDKILHGGIPEFATVLIAGAPGTGKTILAQNILYNVAGEDAKVLYISTIGEPQIKVLRYQQEFGFFSKQAFMDSVLYHDLGSTIRSQGTIKSLEEIDELVMQYNPTLIVIDSLKAVSDFIGSPKVFREFVYDLNLKLSLWEATVLFLGEYKENQVQDTPEAALVDGIVYLYGTEERRYQKRYLRILKMRGTDFAPGEHIMAINSDGIQIYPRLGADLNKVSTRVKGILHSTGITGLDEMLNGGLPAGTTTLVSGGTGTGKSILSLRWLIQGISQGEPGLLISFDESEEQIIATGTAFGWDVQAAIETKLLLIEHVSPVELDVDLHFYRVQKLAAELGLKRIVIDSISTFEIGMSDKVKYTDYMWGMADYFKAMGTSLMLIHESTNLFKLHVTKHGISYIADNIIYLHYYRNEFALSRLIGVLKMRGNKHDNYVRQYIIGEHCPEVVPLPPAQELGSAAAVRDKDYHD